MSDTTYQKARWKAVEEHGCEWFECLGCGREFGNLVRRAEHEAWDCSEAETKMRLMKAGYM